MKFRLTALMASLAVANIAYAATEIDLHNQPVAYIQQANAKVKLQQLRIDTDFNGTTHTRIQQTYEGIPVWHATGIIHAPKAKQHAIAANTTMNGKVYEGLEKDLRPVTALAFTASSAEGALRVAKNNYLKVNRLSSATSFQDEKSKPIIFVDENKQAHRAYLTSFTYTAASSIHRPTSIVDAVTKKVYRSWDGIFTISSIQEQAIAKFKKMLDDNNNNDGGLYDITAGGIGGNTKIGEIVYDGAQNNHPGLKVKAGDIDIEFNAMHMKYTICALMNDDIKVVDASTDDQVVFGICAPNLASHNNVAWLSMNKGNTRWNEDEMNGGYSPSLDAFSAAVAIKNMYQDWFNVPALIEENGKPMKFVLRTHYGRKFDNAYWDGKQMTFGDGGSMFYPLASLSVAAHEISHGFTDTYSHIDGFEPQMGALHESFSDMAAVAVENYLTGKNGWDIGREVMKNEGALRYLDEPTKDGTSIDNMKDFDETEAHSGAGVTNKAFYLLATTKGWNTHKAFEVMAKANMHYWNSSMKTFGEAACGVLSATKDYGYNMADVRIAFAKVGIATDNCEVV